MPARPPPSPQPSAAACPRLGGQPAAVLSPARPPSRRSRSPCFTRLASHAPPLADLKFGADTWEGKARGQGAGHGCPRPLGLAPESRRQPQQPGQPPVPARLGDPDSGAFLPTPWSPAREQGQRELRLRYRPCMRHRPLNARVGACPLPGLLAARPLGPTSSEASGCRPRDTAQLWVGRPQGDVALMPPTSEGTLAFFLGPLPRPWGRRPERSRRALLQPPPL